MCQRIREKEKDKDYLRTIYLPKTQTMFKANLYQVHSIQLIIILLQIKKLMMIRMQKLMQPLILKLINLLKDQKIIHLI